MKPGGVLPYVIEGKESAELSVPSWGQICHSTISSLGRDSSHGTSWFSGRISYTPKKARWRQHSAKRPALKVKVGGTLLSMDMVSDLQETSANSTSKKTG